MSLKSLILFIVVLNIKCSTAQDKIAVTVLYESLCPDSIRFMTSQLYPTLQKSLSKYIDLELIPFGKAKKIGENEFECRHQPIECSINKLQLCALEKIGKKEDNLGFNKVTVAFINCLMAKKKDYPELKSLTEHCAKESSVNDIANIETCANGTEGSELLAKAGNETMHRVEHLESVPTVLLNNAIDKPAIDNFPKALCQLIEGDKPAECQKSGSTSITSMIQLIAVPVLTVLLFNY